MKIPAAVLLCALFSLNAPAALVRGTVSGDVTSADAGNTFGRGAGDTIELVVTYDDSALTGPLPGVTRDAGRRDSRPVTPRVSTRRPAR